MTDRKSRSPQEPPLEEILELFSAHLDGELDPEGEARLSRLLESRPEARAEIRRFRAAVETARAVGTDSPPAGFREGILRTLADEGRPRGGRERRPARRSVRWVVVVSGLAAVLLLALVVPRIGWMLPRPESAERSPTARRPVDALDAKEARADKKLEEGYAGRGGKGRDRAVEEGSSETRDRLRSLGYLAPTEAADADGSDVAEVLEEQEIERETAEADAAPEPSAKETEGPKGGGAGALPAPSAEALDAPSDAAWLLGKGEHPAYLLEYDPERISLSDLEARIAGYAAAPPSRGLETGLAVLEAARPGIRSAEPEARTRPSDADRETARGRLDALSARASAEATVAVEEFREVAVSRESWNRMLEGLGEFGIRPVRIARIEPAPERSGGGADARAKDLSRRAPEAAGRKGDTARPRAEDGDRGAAAAAPTAESIVTVRLFLVPRGDRADGKQGGTGRRRE